MKSGTLTALVITPILIASVACSHRPTEVATLNIEALVEANKVLDVLVEAKVKEVVAALPTSTPYPTYTSVPTPSPIPTTTVVVPPTLPTTVTPAPLPTATRTLVPPPTVTLLPTVRSRGSLPVFTFPTATPDVPNIDDKWVNNLESLVEDLINKERLDNNLTVLEHDPALADIARLHSQDMAALDYFETENIDGESPSERARKAGYNCQNKRLGEWLYTGVAVNLAMYPLDRWQDGDVTYNYYYHLPDELAFEIVSGEDSWMTDGNRDLILNPVYITQGVGVAVLNRGPTKVYVTQNLSVCNFIWRSKK